MDEYDPTDEYDPAEEEWYESPVASICKDPQNQQFSMTREAFEGLGREYRPDTLYTNEDLSDVTDADLPGVSSITSNASMQDQMMSMLNMISSMISALRSDGEKVRSCMMRKELLLSRPEAWWKRQRRYVRISGISDMAAHWSMRVLSSLWTRNVCSVWHLPTN